MKMGPNGLVLTILGAIPKGVGVYAPDANWPTSDWTSRHGQYFIGGLPALEIYMRRSNSGDTCAVSVAPIQWRACKYTYVRGDAVASQITEKVLVAFHHAYIGAKESDASIIRKIRAAGENWVNEKMAGTQADFVRQKVQLFYDEIMGVEDNRARNDLKSLFIRFGKVLDEETVLRIWRETKVSEVMES